jgi:hypothetical protein
MAQRKIKTKTNLEAARKLIDKPQKWKRTWGCDNGERIGPRRSLYDAIYSVTQTSPHPTEEFRALGKAANCYHSVDALLAYERDHNHKDLMGVFDRAIASLN